MRFALLLRYAWASPASLVGLLLALPMCLRGARIALVNGVLEVAALPRAARPEAQGPRYVAITFGHVVLGESQQVLQRWRLHEHQHVRQYERWGVLFFPAYGLASLHIWLRGGRPYWDNPFEREARAAEMLVTRSD